MADDVIIPDLWPADIAPEIVLTPRAILERQAKAVGEKTSGRLEGSIESEEYGAHLIFHFRISAPSINYSMRLFRFRHLIELVYPVTLLEKARDAADQHELMQLLSELLSSQQIRSIFQALLARVGAGQ